MSFALSPSWRIYEFGSSGVCVASGNATAHRRFRPFRRSVLFTVLTQIPHCKAVNCPITFIWAKLPHLPLFAVLELTIFRRFAGGITQLLNLIAPDDLNCSQRTTPFGNRYPSNCDRSQARGDVFLLLGEAS